VIQGYNSSLTMLGGGGGGISNDTSQKITNKEETSQTPQNDLDDEIPF